MPIDLYPNANIINRTVVGNNNHITDNVIQCYFRDVKFRVTHFKLTVGYMEIFSDNVCMTMNFATLKVLKVSNRYVKDGKCP